MPGAPLVSMQPYILAPFSVCLCHTSRLLLLLALAALPSHPTSFCLAFMPSLYQCSELPFVSNLLVTNSMQPTFQSLPGRLLPAFQRQQHHSTQAALHPLRRSVPWQRPLLQRIPFLQAILAGSRQLFKLWLRTPPAPRVQNGMHCSSRAGTGQWGSACQMGRSADRQAVRQGLAG